MSNTTAMKTDEASSTNEPARMAIYKMFSLSSTTALSSCGLTSPPFLMSLINGMFPTLASRRKMGLTAHSTLARNVPSASSFRRGFLELTGVRGGRAGGC